MKILVLRGGALGDFIVTLPALRALADHWPGARIELVGNTVAAQLGLQAGWLHAAHSQHEARWSALFIPATLPVGFRAWLDSFDRIVSFWADPDGTLRSHFAHRGNEFISSHPQVTSSPAARHFCDALIPWGVTTSGLSVRLDVPPAEVRDVRDRPWPVTPFIALHPGSGSPRKNWPMERWQELCGRLTGPLLVITGEADQPLHCDRADLVRAHSWPLPTLAAALREASLYIGHDTGVSHLAAAVGTPCALLFGPTEPAIWAPPGRHVQVLRKGPSLSALQVEDVLAALVVSPARDVA